MSTKEQKLREKVEFWIMMKRKFIKDAKEAGVQFNIATFEEWLENLKEIVKYRK